jgi:hypothetical protein
MTFEVMPVVLILTRKEMIEEERVSKHFFSAFEQEGEMVMEEKMSLGSTAGVGEDVCWTFEVVLELLAGKGEEDEETETELVEDEEAIVSFFSFFFQN